MLSLSLMSELEARVIACSQNFFEFLPELEALEWHNNLVEFKFRAEYFMIDYKIKILQLLRPRECYFDEVALLPNIKCELGGIAF